ncbi:MAG: efflux RND transporter periplasmic adaptor subunit [Rhodospirillaceae bacterium]|nr:efflux RND transporter periplasmic adaptor subunit [Rhodospirillaceae bacterium]MBT5527193.1 efflux RND transporter periplasmic adaptor subunit [Rhodospirillaceae bacterium]MBT5882089.1 efflux RND transporter periplasmic adaptor subunit [Rhodospirillaceae bacterium]MBT6589679.1 efflux RND transporter periplasmic adaptor subunit [Rhodospirillaceae bacterium]MBT6913629.1 efflux RND transporter periplasmic adaptor subunit [Rhodospirillaceae bacterium]
MTMIGPAQAQKTSAKKGPSAALVSVDKVLAQSVSQTIPVVGRLVARRSGVVAARVAGPVSEIRADVGDRVQKGDVLAVLVREQLHWVRERRFAEVTSRKAQLAARKAEMVMKNQEMQRLEKLKKGKSAAHRAARFDDKRQEVMMLNSEVAEATARLRQAEADAKLAQINLRYASIRAPFSGVVIRRYTEVGSYLTVGKAVVEIIDDTALEVEADVPVKRVVNLSPGTPVSVIVHGQTVAAKVRAVVPQENPLTRTRAVRFTAELTALHGRLAGNQSVTVAIPITAAEKVVSVHKDAILKRRGNDMVFVVEKGAAQPRTIRIGDAVGGRFVVEDGLKVGEVVVVRGNERLFPGQPVRF